MLNLDSGGKCFLCRKNRTSAAQREVNLRNIYCYLRINVSLAVSRAASRADCPVLATPNKEDVTVSACLTCSEVANQVSTLCHELQVLQVRLTQAVQSLHTCMEEKGGGEVEKGEAEGARRSKADNTLNASQRIQASLVQLLWEETKEKCAARLSNEPSSAQFRSEKLKERINVKVETPSPTPSSDDSEEEEGEEYDQSGNEQLSSSQCEEVVETRESYNQKASPLPTTSIRPKNPVEEQLGARHQKSVGGMHCPNCRLKFWSKISLDQHLTHNCGSEIPQNSCLKDLWKSRSEDNRFFCPYCAKKMIRGLKTLHLHVISYHPGKLLLCCKPPGMKEKAWAECTVHVLDELVNSAAGSLTTQQQVTCTICSESWNELKNLRFHFVIDHTDVVRDKLAKLVTSINGLNSSGKKIKQGQKRLKTPEAVNRYKERVREKQQLARQLTTGVKHVGADTDSTGVNSSSLSLSVVADSCKKVEDGNIFCCVFCQKSVTSRTNMRQHLVCFHVEQFLVKAKTNMAKEMDDEDFKRLCEQLMADTHTGSARRGKKKGSIQCDHCDRVYNDRRSILCHLVEVHKWQLVTELKEMMLGGGRRGGGIKGKKMRAEKKPAAPGVCDKGSSWGSRAGLLTRQLKKENKLFACPHCDSTFKDSGPARRHLVLEHCDKLLSSADTQVMLAGISEEEFKDCCKTLLEQETGAPKSVRGFPHFVCTYCSVSYSDTWRLQAHLLENHHQSGRLSHKLIQLQQKNVPKIVKHEQDEEEEEEEDNGKEWVKEEVQEDEKEWVKRELLEDEDGDYMEEQDPLGI